MPVLAKIDHADYNFCFLDVLLILQTFSETAMKNSNARLVFIWSVADLICAVFKRSKYQNNGLAPTKQGVLDVY